jgi:hypothetical protein
MRNRLILVLVAALALLGAESASACSCVGPSEGQSIDEFLRDTAKRSDAVVTARLIEVETGPAAPPPAFEPAEFTFRIQRVYKQRNLLEPGELLRIRSYVDSGANCGLPDHVGFRSGMFLERFRGAWSTSSCSLASPGALRDALGGRGSGRSSASGAAGCANAA